MSCRNSDNDTGTFRDSDISSFEIQTRDMDNHPYGAASLRVLSKSAPTHSDLWSGNNE